jgi:hypothetical protein
MPAFSVTIIGSAQRQGVTEFFRRRRSATDTAKATPMARREISRLPSR